MERKDIITCAENLARQEKYSITVYIDVKGNYTFMTAGVAEICWPEDIKEIYGVLMYVNGDTNFLDFTQRSNWSQSDCVCYDDYVKVMLDPSVAKREYESRSPIGSRFEWPQDKEKIN